MDDEAFHWGGVLFQGTTPTFAILVFSIEIVAVEQLLKRKTLKIGI